MKNVCVDLQRMVEFCTKENTIFCQQREKEMSEVTSTSFTTNDANRYCREVGKRQCHNLIALWCGMRAEMRTEGRS